MTSRNDRRIDELDRLGEVRPEDELIVYDVTEPREDNRTKRARVSDFSQSTNVDAVARTAAQEAQAAADTVGAELQTEIQAREAGDATIPQPSDADSRQYPRNSITRNGHQICPRRP